MSLSEMARLAKSSGLAKNDAQWWPKWMGAYARSVHQVDAPRIDISRESLISLLQRMRDSGKSAWVRLQVVRAVEFYQKSALQSSVPDLSDVRLGGLTGGLGRAKPSDRLPISTVAKQSRGNVGGTEMFSVPAIFVSHPYLSAASCPFSIAFNSTISDS